MSKDKLGLVAAVLVVVGALNWGLIGFFEYNLVQELVGALLSGDAAVNVERVIYGVVGLAGVYQAVDLVQNNK